MGSYSTGSALVRRDAVSDGLASVAGAYALEPTPGFRDAVEAGQPVAVEDVRTTDLLDEPLRRLCEQHDVRALLAVPVRQDGQPVGLLALRQRTPRRWTPQEVALVAEVAERARAAVVRTSREAALRRRERQQAFLVQLNDALRPLEAPAAIQGTATRLLREQFRADWCYYVEWDETGTVGEVLRDDTCPGLPFMMGRHDVADAPEFTSFLRNGQLLNVPDFARCDLFTLRVVATYTGIGIHACLCASLVKNGRLIATLTLADTQPHEWPAAAVALVQEVAERTWATLERARAEEARRQISWGEPFLDEQRYAQAIDIYEFVNTLYPDSPRAAFYLALAYDKNQDRAHAIEHYQRVLSFWPDMSEAKQSIIRLRAQLSSN